MLNWGKYEMLAKSRREDALKDAALQRAGRIARSDAPRRPVIHWRTVVISAAATAAVAGLAVLIGVRW